MVRVLIPFREPEAAARAVSQLLDEGPDPRLSVHLLAAVEPLVPGKVLLYVSPERAKAQVMEAASRWLAPLEATLTAAGIPCTSEIVVGSPRATIRAAAERTDVDRILLPAPRWQWLAKHTRRRIEQRSRHPVTLVA
jgi:nucleotide-binding universal stress UspA family protein